MKVVFPSQSCHIDSAKYESNISQYSLTLCFTSVLTRLMFGSIGQEVTRNGIWDHYS
jgi:hypothetical protein